MNPCELRQPQNVLSPCLLVAPDIIRQNLQECIRIAGSVQRLRPHVKTHKTPEIVEMQLQMGIVKHKCATLSEAQMLAQTQASDVLLAYPLVGPSIARFCEMVGQFPKCRFTAVVEDRQTLAELERHFSSHGTSIDVMVDVDTGMHRTGITPGGAVIELVEAMQRTKACRFDGLHVYDGQNHQSALSERQAAVTALLQPVLALVGSLAARNIAVPKLVCGGTPTFPVFADQDFPDGALVECSPGTSVLSDFNYGRDYADMSGIRPAAWVMTRVISKQHTHRMTLDLGHKAVAADTPMASRCFFPELPDAQCIQHSEEHLVIETSAAENYQIGDVLYGIPGHICPTVALHSHLQVVQNGQITDCWEVTARNRIY